MFEHPNAVLVRRLYQAFAEKDPETLSELIDEEAVWRVPGRSTVAGEHRGRKAVFEYFGRLREATDGTFKAELLDALASDTHAVALARASARRGQKTYEGHYCLLFKIEDGSITEATLFQEDGYAFDELLR